MKRPRLESYGLIPSSSDKAAAADKKLKATAKQLRRVFEYSFLKKKHLESMQDEIDEKWIILQLSMK